MAAGAAEVGNVVTSWHPKARPRMRQAERVALAITDDAPTGICYLRCGSPGTTIAPARWYPLVLVRGVPKLGQTDTRRGDVWPATRQ